MPRRKRTSTRSAAPDASTDDDLLSVAPLFEDADGEAAYFTVTRTDPDEGYLGRLPPGAAEADITKKWGGGTFALSLRTQSGKPIKGAAHKSVQIAGDPVFASVAAQRKWERAQGLAADGKAAGGAAAPADRPLGFGELMLLLEKQGERARAEAREAAEQRSRELAATHERQLALVKADNERRAAELKEDRERLLASLANERERDKQFMATMLEAARTSRPEGDGGAGAMKALLAGVELAKSFGGGGDGESDPLVGLVNNLPGVISEMGKLARGEKTPPARQLPAAPARAAARPNGKGGAAAEPVTLHGELGEKAKRLAVAIKQAGGDPEAELARAFDAMTAQVPAAAAAARAAQASGKNEKPAPAAPSRKRPPVKKPPARNGTSTGKSATQ